MWGDEPSTEFAYGRLALEILMAISERVSEWPEQSHVSEVRQTFCGSTETGFRYVQWWETRVMSPIDKRLEKDVKQETTPELIEVLFPPPNGRERIARSKAPSRSWRKWKKIRRRPTE